jgi:hypothetical protein
MALLTAVTHITVIGNGLISISDRVLVVLVSVKKATSLMIVLTEL